MDDPALAHKNALLRIEKLKKELAQAEKEAADLLPAPPKKRLGKGHLFVTRGDIRAITCDAWLISSFSFRSVPQHWLPAGSKKDVFWGASPDPVAGYKFVRRIPENKWPSGLIPYSWGGNPDDLDLLCAVQYEYVKLATEDLKGTQPANRRERHLLLLPLLATGLAGQRDRAGLVISKFLPLLEKLAADFEVDICLVVYEQPIYSMTQKIRRTKLSRFADHLSNADRCEAERLSELAKNGALSLFIGAGVSINAGLPSWGSLLDKISAKAKMSKEDVDRMWSLGFLDQAKLLEKRLGSSSVLREEIVRLVSSDRYSMLHAMLSMIPSSSVVTTNYDTLYERACSATQTPLCVLPYEKTGPGKFLLKLHGCVEHPEDIVLTRDDYMHYEEKRQALASVVQSTIIQTHMLFVGFSLQDENYVKIIDSVTKLYKNKERLNGTALFLFANAFESDLNRLNVFPMSPALKPGEKEGPNAPPFARKLEIFCDYLAMMSCSTINHLQDSGFQEVLSPGELEFSKMLNLITDSTQVTPTVLETEGYQNLLNYVLSTFGKFESSIKTTEKVDVPFLVKREDTVESLLLKIADVYHLLTYRLYKRNLEELLKTKVFESFQNGNVIEVVGQTSYHSFQHGILLKYGWTRFVQLSVKLTFLENEDELDKGNCHHWEMKQGCLKGKQCPWNHIGDD